MGGTSQRLGGRSGEPASLWRPPSGWDGRWARKFERRAFGNRGKAGARISLQIYAHKLMQDLQPKTSSIKLRPNNLTPLSVASAYPCYFTGIQRPTQQGGRLRKRHCMFTALNVRLYTIANRMYTNANRMYTNVNRMRLQT